MSFCKKSLTNIFYLLQAFHANLRRNSTILLRNNTQTQSRPSLLQSGKRRTKIQETYVITKIGYTNPDRKKD